MLELVFDGGERICESAMLLFVMKWTVICLWLKESV